jgi:ankyrin repeat protein
MKTDSYVYGVEPLNGHDAWALFEACAFGDLPRTRTLLAKDSRLVNAQHDYQFPIHMAVRQGHAEIVKLLLAQGADPGQSRFMYNSWDRLLACAGDRGYDQVASILERAMHRRFNYAPGFDRLKEAIVARNPRRVAAVLRRHPELASASDALGNNALHWSVLTRQLDLIERFVELGTPIDAKRADGQTPRIRSRPPGSASCSRAGSTRRGRTGSARRSCTPVPRTATRPWRLSFSKPGPTSTPVTWTMRRRWPPPCAPASTAKIASERGAAGRSSPSSSPEAPRPTFPATSRGQHHWPGHASAALRMLTRCF